jgi:hypothetical protein
MGASPGEVTLNGWRVWSIVLTDGRLGRHWCTHGTSHAANRTLQPAVYGTSVDDSMPV